MYGAMIGDIVGSKYEFNNIKTKDFHLFSAGCSFTDDTVMTVSVAKALLRCPAPGPALSAALVEEMQALGRIYPHPQGGYGGRFASWLRAERPEPYHSYGNGSAMRVSPCGILAGSLEEALALAEASAAVTHDHPEGIKGAQAVAAAIYLARSGADKREIRRFVEERFYPLNRTLAEIRPNYGFFESCQKTVPEAIIAFLESESFEDAVRNAVSLGGDSDTIGAITGSIAWAYYGRDGLRGEMEQIRRRAERYLPEEFRRTAELVEAQKKAGSGLARAVESC